MEMQFKNEIKKLADVVVWADNLITSAGYDEEKYKETGATAYCPVKAHELWKIKTVVLDSMERHTVYTNALNKDIADKAAKIDLLEKEIEGRKEGYYALKDKMTDLEETLEIRTKENRSLIKANEKLEKESEKWQDLAKMNRDTISDQYGVCEEFKNKIAELEKEIESRKNAFNALKEEMATRYIAIETHNDICKTYEKKVTELEKELEYCRVKIRHHKENLNGINKTLEIRNKENDSLVKTIRTTRQEIEAHESENARLSEKIVELKRTIEKCKDYDNSLIDSLRINNDDLKEQVSNLKKELEKAHDRIDAENRMYKMLYAEYEKLEKLKKKEDDHGRAGFKRYIEYLIEEEERSVPERFKARLNEEIETIFAKEEETEVKDIPCGSDSIE